MKKTSIILFLLLFATSFAFGQKEKFEAIYIYNFTKKIEWPKEASTGDFVIGIYGDTELITELQKVAASRKVGTRSIVIKTFTEASEIETCHILFVAEDKCGKLSEAKAKLAGAPTLFVTDKSGMAKKGAGINFFMKDGKLKFELNEKEVESKGLKVGDALKKLATII